MDSNGPCCFYLFVFYLPCYTYQFPYLVNDDWLSQGDEYEPAPGKVSLHPHFHNGICWTHGNFVAQKKSSGCFSFLPAPRTLFFFELAYRNRSDEVVTCTALGMIYFFYILNSCIFSRVSLTAHLSHMYSLEDHSHLLVPEKKKGKHHKILIRRHARHMEIGYNGPRL